MTPIEQQWKIHNEYCTEIRTKMNKGLASWFLKLPIPMTYETWKHLHKIKGDDGMTKKRFYVDKSGDFRDNKTGVVIVDFGYNFNGMECRDILELMNKLNEKNEQLKKELDKIKVVNEMLSMAFANSEHELSKENEELKQSNEQILKDIDLALGFIRHKGYSLQDIKDYEDAKKEYEEDLANYRKGDVE